MLLPIRELTSKGLPQSYQERIPANEWHTPNPDLIASSPLDVEITAVPSGTTVKLEGKLVSEVVLVCSRCLTHFPYKLDVDYEETLQWSNPVMEIPKPEDEEIRVVTEDRVELAPFYEEQMILALPFVPVCRRDCAGLCPVCGMNRNEHSCDCTQDDVDPRLAGLKDFFK